MNNLSMALKNLKKNFSFYALYLLSVSFVITVFFAFTSFSMNTVMLEKISGNGRVEMMCNVISVFLMAFVVFYMSYSNRFFLRRRTKELGVYALLGYRKTTVLSLLTTENLLVCFGAFLFQNSGYKYQKLINLCLTGTCIFALIGVLVSSKIFFLLYFIQFMASWLCFIFTVIYHRKRVAFVFKSEWRHIIFSLIAVIVLFLTYYFSTMRVPEHLSNFGVYIPILLFWVSIHGIILKEQNSLPLSAVFSNRQLTLLIFSGVIIFSLIAIILNGGYSLLFIMLDALFAFLYVCNIALDFNFKKGHNKIIKESKYHVALQQLQREEQLNLEFANFLHDDILQDLLSVKNMMKKADRPEVQKIITETLDNMNTYIREQMQDYHPTLLPKLTIKENYQNLLDGISQSFPNRNICVSFDCSDSLFLVEPYNIFVYRLLKELVTNVYKHSTGEKAWITLTQDNGIIILNVSDNGTVDADVLSSADRLKHRGLAMITERVNDMDGSVTISNNHPHGICVQTILPMKGDVSYQHFVSR